MIDSRDSLNAAEREVMAIFKKAYWPNQAKCNQIQALAHDFPSAESDPTSFNEALMALKARGYITTNDNHSYCLTKLGVQKIGAAP